MHMILLQGKEKNNIDMKKGRHTYHITIVNQEIQDQTYIGKTEGTKLRLPPSSILEQVCPLLQSSNSL